MGKLAINGGEKAVTSTAKFQAPRVSEKGMEAAVDLMKKGEISISPIVDEFEKEFAEYIGTKYALASNSGTSSLHEALFAAGISAGDEVIVPSFTFGTSASSILAARGIPVFCDVDRETYCMDPEDVEKRVTSRTRAIMPVHVFGNPCDMERILGIARRHNLKVIEDCSHAHGAEWKDKKIGSIGDVGAFSLQGGKLMPAGEGGVLATNDTDYYERAIICGRMEKSRNIPEDSRYKKQGRLLGLGFKHRPHPVGIAIAREHLRDLDKFNIVRNKNGQYIDKAFLSEVPCVKPQKSLPGSGRVYSYHYACYDKNLLGGVSVEVFTKALAAEGVICGLIGYGRLHETPFFEKGSVYYHECCLGRCPHSRPPEDFEKPDLPATAYLRENSFNPVPRFDYECKDLLDQYIEAYKKVASSVDELIAYEKENKDKLGLTEVGTTTLNLVK